jgi:hypothetical protein
MDLYE